MYQLPELEKPKEKKRLRKIWTEEEDKDLCQLASIKGKKCWDDIANQLNSIYKNDKTGKQCRERFRNYVNPALQNSSWKPQEKLVFILLHKLFNNRWRQISGYLNQRSDIMIKNYYYSMIRKALRFYKQEFIPPSMIQKPAKLYQMCYLIEILNNQYLPHLYKELENNFKGHKEKILIKLLKDSKATNATLKKYEDILIANFKERHKSSGIPVILTLDLLQAGVPTGKLNDIIESENLFNSSPINEVLIIKFFNNSQKPIIPQSESVPVLSQYPVIPQFPFFGPPPPPYFPYFGIGNQLYFPQVPYVPQLSYPNLYPNALNFNSAKNEEEPARKIKKDSQLENFNP